MYNIYIYTYITKNQACLLRLAGGQWEIGFSSVMEYYGKQWKKLTKLGELITNCLGNIIYILCMFIQVCCGAEAVWPGNPPRNVALHIHNYLYYQNSILTSKPITAELFP